MPIQNSQNLGDQAQSEDNPTLSTVPFLAAQQPEELESDRKLVAARANGISTPCNAAPTLPEPANTYQQQEIDKTPAPDGT